MPEFLEILEEYVESRYGVSGSEAVRLLSPEPVFRHRRRDCAGHIARGDDALLGEAT